ncbi:unannotated protein [freshwater metagenome]|uniref:Unannotated protein n=1 Tax=freshwater metagenome TaxID=449393 RepID=A0A6J6FLI0_9ZZZZ
MSRERREHVEDSASECNLTSARHEVDALVTQFDERPRHLEQVPAFAYRNCEEWPVS